MLSLQQFCKEEYFLTTAFSFISLYLSYQPTTKRYVSSTRQAVGSNQHHMKSKNQLNLNKKKYCDMRLIPLMGVWEMRKPFSAKAEHPPISVAKCSTERKQDRKRAREGWES